jgi:hypothetical protein
MRTALAFAATFSLTVALSSSALAQDPNAAPPPAAAPASPTSSPPMIETTSRSPGETSNAFTLWGILAGGGYGWGGYGIGARFMMPVGIPRLLTRTPFKDYWAIEFGADLRTWSQDYVGFNGSYRWTEILPLGGIMWQFWLNSDVAFYPKAEAGWGIGWYSSDVAGGTRSSHGGIHLDGAAGVIYKIGDGLTLRGEVGYTGLKGGVAWTF